MRPARECGLGAASRVLRAFVMVSSALAKLQGKSGAERWHAAGAGGMLRQHVMPAACASGWACVGEQEAASASGRTRMRERRTKRAAHRIELCVQPSLLLGQRGGTAFRRNRKARKWRARGRGGSHALAIVRHSSQGGGQGTSKAVSVLPAALARKNPRDGDLCACLELGVWLCRLIELLATWAFAFWRGGRCAVEGFNMHISRFLAGKYPSGRSGSRRGREKQLFPGRRFALLGGCGRFLRSFRSLGASVKRYEK